MSKSEILSNIDEWKKKLTPKESVDIEYFLRVIPDDILEHRQISQAIQKLGTINAATASALQQVLYEYSQCRWSERQQEAQAMSQSFKALSKVPGCVLNAQSLSILFVIIAYTRTVEVSKNSYSSMHVQHIGSSPFQQRLLIKNTHESSSIDFSAVQYPKASKVILSSQFHRLLKIFKSALPEQELTIFKNKVIDWDLDVNQASLEACSNNEHLTQEENFIRQFELLSQSIAGELAEGDESEHIKHFIELLKEKNVVKSNIGKDASPLKGSHNLQRILSKHTTVLSHFAGKNSLLIWQNIKRDSEVMDCFEKLSPVFQALIANLVSEYYLDIAPKPFKGFIQTVYYRSKHSPQYSQILQLIILSKLSFNDKKFLLSKDNINYCDFLYKNELVAFLFLFRDNISINQQSFEGFKTEVRDSIHLYPDSFRTDACFIAFKSMVGVVLDSINSPRVLGAPSLVSSVLKTLAGNLPRVSAKPPVNKTPPVGQGFSRGH